MKKVDLHTMPRPLRIFGYLIRIGMVLMVATIILVSYFR